MHMKPEDIFPRFDWLEIVGCWAAIAVAAALGWFAIGFVGGLAWWLVKAGFAAAGAVAPFLPFTPMD